MLVFEGKPYKKYFFQKKNLNKNLLNIKAVIEKSISSNAE